MTSDGEADFRFYRGLAYHKPEPPRWFLWFPAFPHQCSISLQGDQPDWLFDHYPHRHKRCFAFDEVLTMVHDRTVDLTARLEVGLHGVGPDLASDCSAHVAGGAVMHAIIDRRLDDRRDVVRQPDETVGDAGAGCRYFRGTLPSYCDSRSRATPSIPHVCSLSPHPLVLLIPAVITEDGCFESLPLQGNLAGVRHSIYGTPQRCGSIPRCTATVMHVTRVVAEAGESPWVSAAGNQDTLPRLHPIPWLM
jgi:hypothetical protein